MTKKVCIKTTNEHITIVQDTLDILLKKMLLDPIQGNSSAILLDIEPAYVAYYATDQRCNDIGDMNLSDIMKLFCHWAYSCKHDNIYKTYAYKCKMCFQLSMAFHNMSGEHQNIPGFIEAIKSRVQKHDLSKLEDPELSTFMEYTDKLKTVTYGSQEYIQFLEEMQPALKHHYQNNRHHPEHHKNGIAGMNLIDLIEMFCDWYAATKRHDDGDIHKSIEHNKKRFGMSDQLASIFTNTVSILD